MAATLEKNVGSPRTVADVQKKRKIVSVAMVVDDDGKYSMVISYQQWEVDGTGAILGPVETNAHTVDDATLPAAAKTQIDGIYTRALNVL